MTKKSKLAFKIAGIVLIVAGIGLAFWGHQLSGSFGSKITKTITGSYSDKIMTLYIGGAASFVVGLFLTIKR